MTQQQQVNDARDAELYIARLGEFPRKFAQVINGIKLREAKGVVPPKFTVEKVLAQIKAFVASGASLVNNRHGPKHEIHMTAVLVTLSGRLKQTLANQIPISNILVLRSSIQNLKQASPNLTIISVTQKDFLLEKSFRELI